MFDPRAADAGIEARNDIDVRREVAKGGASCSAARERVPSPAPTVVPAIIVLAAIGATVARMNRRGGPR
jgi:hypothetical protein